MKRFAEEKLRVLSDKTDLSRKGSIDAPIQDLVGCLNASDHYYTTSSCSGRIVLYANEGSEVRKRGCQWLMSSHDPITQEQLAGALEKDLPSNYTFLKFEPFVLHVVCREQCDAQCLLQAAVAAGFRNSGVMVGKKQRLVLAVRSTLTLEAPVAHNQRMIVSEEYLTHLVSLTNQKLAQNLQNIVRFSENVQELLTRVEQPHLPLPPHTKRAVDRERTIKTVVDHSEVTFDSELQLSSDLEQLFAVDNDSNLS